MSTDGEYVIAVLVEEDVDVEEVDDGFAAAVSVEGLQAMVVEM